MDPNTHSTQPATGLDRLAAVVDQLATEDLDALPDAEAARRVLVLRRLLERREGQWLRELAGVDGRGAAGTDHGTPAEATAGWLRHRTRMGTPTPTSASGSPAPCTAAPGWHRPGAGGWGAQLPARGGVDPRHPAPPRRHHGGGGAGAAGRRPPPAPAPAAQGRRAPG
jgi:hypothetical protein